MTCACNVRKMFIHQHVIIIITVSGQGEQTGVEKIHARCAEVKPSLCLQVAWSNEQYKSSLFFASLQYDTLYVDKKCYKYNPVEGRVVEHTVNSNILRMTEDIDSN